MDNSKSQNDKCFSGLTSTEVELLKFIGENENFIEYVELVPQVVSKHPEIKSVIINQILITKGESNIKISATYGTEEYAINITDELLFYFSNGDELIIRRENKFNDFFGDPHFGVVKDLIINILDTHTLVINENHNSNYKINLTNGEIKEFFNTVDSVFVESDSHNKINTQMEIITI